MPNIRKRKTDRGVPLPLLQRASNEVQEGKSVRAVAKSHDICHVTLYRFHKKRLRLESQGSKSPQRVGYWTPKKVFSTEQEILLRDYLMEAADLYYGLSSKEQTGFSHSPAYVSDYHPTFLSSSPPGCRSVASLQLLPIELRPMKPMMKLPMPVQPY
ncbi:Phosphoglucosamine mutase, partial [Dissostichus eleginoides]